MTGLFLTIFLAILNAILIEMIFDTYWIREHRMLTGFSGTFLVLVAMLYSLRKRRIFRFGSMKMWLRTHEWLAIAGTFVIFVHVGTHFRAILPMVALLVMFSVFVSGLIGRYVYREAKLELRSKTEELKSRGLPEHEVEQKLWVLSVTSSTLARWRSIHGPMVFILALLVVAHTISALYFSGL